MKSSISSHTTSALLIIFTASMLIFGCAQKDKPSDEYQSMQLEGESSPENPEGEKRIETTLTPDEVAQPKNTLPETPYPTSDEATQDTGSTPDAEAVDPYAATIPEEKAPPIPTTTSAPAKAKPIKKTVKFKLPKKSTAQALLTEDGKAVKITFSATKVKKGKYMLFMEKSCKKNQKTKPLKVAQFIVKNGDKFSGSAQTKVISLKSGKLPGKVQSLKGKALVLYHGPKANTRLSCEMIK